MSDENAVGLKVHVVGNLRVGVDRDVHYLSEEGNMSQEEAFDAFKDYLEAARTNPLTKDFFPVALVLCPAKENEDGSFMVSLGEGNRILWAPDIDMESRKLLITSIAMQYIYDKVVVIRQELKTLGSD